MAVINGHPLIIEMVGIAGSGKSSLSRALHAKNHKIVKACPPSKSIYLGYLLTLYTRWFPLYVRKYHRSRWFTWKEIKIMGYLETWLPYLRKCAIENDQIIVLDPGSFYWLTELKTFGPPLTKDQKFVAWWNEMKRRWHGALDLIIWLDAPNELLLYRVNSRDEWHESMLKTSEEALLSFSHYREGYKELMKEILKSRHNHLYEFRTDQISTEKMANKILAEGLN